MTRAAVGRDDGSIIVLDLRTGQRRPMARRAGGRIAALGFSADGELLATTADDGAVDVWDVGGARLREGFEGHAGAANGPLFSADGATLYSGSSDGSIIVWDVRGDRRLGQPFRFSPVAAAGIGSDAPADDASTAVAVSPDGSLFATSPAPGRATLWRASDRSVSATLRGPLGVIDSLAFSRDGRLVAATGEAPETVVWNVASRKVVRRLGPAGERGASGVAISPDGRLVATAGVDGMMRVYELAAGREMATEQVQGSLQDVDFSPDGRRLAAAGLGGDIVVWNVRRRASERTISHGELILAIRFAPDGKTIATGDLRGNVDFWDASSGRRVGHTLGGHNALVLSVSFDPTGDAARDHQRRRQLPALGRRVRQADRLAAAGRRHRRLGAPLPRREVSRRCLRLRDRRRVERRSRRLGGARLPRRPSQPHAARVARPRAGTPLPRRLLVADARSSR